jgi:hypothetical protein
MPGQVRDHLESQRRQYALADVARELGFRRVETIDDDLGVSGSGFAERPGFQRPLTTVGSGTAGAVLALESDISSRFNRLLSTLVHKFGNVFCYATAASADAWNSSFCRSAARSSVVNRHSNGVAMDS